MKVVFVSPLQQQQSSFVAAAGGVTIPHASSFAPASSTMSGGGMHTVELGGGSEQGQGLPKPMPIATHVVPTGAASTPATVTTSATTTQQEPAHATTAASGGASAPPAALRCMCFDLTRLSPLFQLVVLSSGVFFFFILNSFLEEYTFKMIDGFKYVEIRSCYFGGWVGFRLAFCGRQHFSILCSRLGLDGSLRRCNSSA